ncbi:DUF6895 family protein [Streptomyces sp. NPDC050585]|uniref:DUF6895 family protein n=1 Tax=Streptomyces sp. NPDC050585 TaxID=3365632 RepID=UPI00379EF48D
MVRPEAAPEDGYLHRRIDEVLDYACTHLPSLDEYAEWWPSREGELVRVQDKILGETSMLLLIADRAGSGRSSPHWGRLTDLCVRGCRSDRVLCAMARHPRAVSSLGLGHLFLTGLGNVDADVDLVVSHACRTGDVGRQECVPFRRLEFAWAWRQASRFSDWTGLSASVRGWAHESSALAWDSVGIYLNRDDCYALTHTLMYATDFGATGVPGVDVERLRASVSSSICFALAIADYDLLGELLLGDAVLPGEASPAARCGWAVRTRTLNTLGHLPGPPPCEDEPPEDDPRARTAYLFWRDYHPAYVDALLCTSLLGRAEPWFTEPHDTLSAGSVPARIVDTAWPDGDGGPSGRMARTVEELEIPAGLRAPVLAEMAAIALVRRYDLIGLRRLLELLEGTPFKDTGTVESVRRFLTNQFALAATGRAGQAAGT